MVGIVIAFQDYMPFEGIEGMFKSPHWVGFKHFKDFFSSYYFGRVLFNTLCINIFKLVLGFIASLTLALMINEVRLKKFKKFTQTVSYLPHFLSYVIIAGLIQFFLSPTSGPLNTIIAALGGKQIDFLGSEMYFRPILILSHIWTTAGWGSIVYLAALTGISPEMYESADLEGATRIQKILHISIPSIAPIIVIMLILDLGKVLDQGFEQVLLLYSPAVYSVGDIIDTYVYREGILNVNYSYSTAVGLFKSFVSLTLIMASNKIVKLFDDELGVW
jgi:ABC transporter, permease protein